MDNEVPGWMTAGASFDATALPSAEPPPPKEPYQKPKNKANDRRRAILHCGPACILCGFDALVHNHHIFGSKMSRKVEHMAILCPNHHALADLNVITGEALIEAIKVKSEEIQRQGFKNA